MDDDTLPSSPVTHKYPIWNSLWARISNLESLMASLILFFAIGFNLIHLFPQVAIQVPMLNDGVLHRLTLERTVAVLEASKDPADFWLATIDLGFPLFHYYQSLPYILPAIFTIPVREIVDTVGLFNWMNYLLLCLFPLSIYWAMRRFGFSPLAAAWGGLSASLLSTNGLYGFDLNSYLWGGYGMYTQLWGMFLLPIALAQGYSTIKTGRGYFWSVLLLVGITLSHLVYGYIAVISLAMFILIPILGRRLESSQSIGVWLRGKRVLILLVLTILVMAYFLLPYLLDHNYMNRSVWEEPGKYDAYGYAWTLSALVRGELFDYGRFPSFTILVGLGVIICLWHWREERYRIPVTLFIIWLLLYFGRPTWGVLLNLLPLSQDLHFHRLIAGIHLAGILLIGICLGGLWQWSISSKKSWQMIVTVVFTAILLYPVSQERGSYLIENANWMIETQVAFTAEQADLDALVNTLKQLPPGRIYAGLAGNWGSDYKIGDVPVYAYLQSTGFDMLGYLFHALSLNADIQVLFDEQSNEQYNLFNVRYVVAPADKTFPDFVQSLAQYGRFHLYEVATTGYFDLVSSDVAFEGNKNDFYIAASYWLSSDLPRIKQHPAVFLQGIVEGYENIFPLIQASEIIPMASLPSPIDSGRMIGEIDATDTYGTEVFIEKDCFVLLKVTYHPNWHVTVDGAKVDTVMLMPSYLGVKVEPGYHQLLFEYRPQLWRKFLLVGGLLVLLAITFIEWPYGRVIEKILKQSLSKTSYWLKRLFMIISSWNPFRIFSMQLRSQCRYLMLLFGFTLLISLPLFQFKIMSGHDSLEYLPRIVEFYQSLKAGQLFPRWAADLSGGYGQPFFIFNPPLFYYISSAFHAIGFGFISSENLACVFLLYVASLGMYLLAKEIFGRLGGLIVAVAYTFAPYLLVNLYIRHALADFTAMAILPWAFWGLQHYIKSNRFGYLLWGSIFIALLLLSSNPVAIITFPILVLFSIWLAYIYRSWRFLSRGFWCILLGTSLSAYFWLPALVERNYVHLDRLLEGYLNYSNHFVYPAQFIDSAWGYGLSLPGSADGMSFAIGPLYLLFTGITIIILWRNRTIDGYTRSISVFFLVVLGLGVFFASNLSEFLWNKISILQYLEFPWRFLTLVAFCSALLFGLPFKLLKEKLQITIPLAFLLLFGLFVTGYSHAKPQSFLDVNATDYRPQAILDNNIAVTTTNEYEPVWVQEHPNLPRRDLITVLSEEAIWSIDQISPVKYNLSINGTNTAQIQFRIFYYPGWTLYVDGMKRMINYQNPQGVIEFTLEPGDHQLSLVFQSTLNRNIAASISILSVFLILISMRFTSKYKDWIDG